MNLGGKWGLAALWFIIMALMYAAYGSDAAVGFFIGGIVASWLQRIQNNAST